MIPIVVEVPDGRVEFLEDQVEGLLPADVGLRLWQVAITYYFEWEFVTFLQDVSALHLDFFVVQFFGLELVVHFVFKGD